MENPVERIVSSSALRNPDRGLGKRTNIHSIGDPPCGGFYISLRGSNGLRVLGI